MIMKAYRYEFTIKEFLFLFFSKKICPKCNSKLKKEKIFEILNGEEFKSESTPLYIEGRKEVKNYKYLFNCYNCNLKFTLKELLNKKNK